MSNINTLYDDVFRTLLTDCKGLIIPVVNEVFEEHFTGKEKVVLVKLMKMQHGLESYGILLK